MVNHLVESAVNDLDNEEYNSDTEEGTYINKITLYKSINGTYIHDNIILYACIGLVQYYEDVHKATIKTQST